jgi:hypothetical protein
MSRSTSLALLALAALAGIGLWAAGGWTWLRRHLPWPGGEPQEVEQHHSGTDAPVRSLGRATRTSRSVNADGAAPRPGRMFTN